jgi:hypothetical protein
MSEVAFFVKDVVGPRGAVSIFPTRRRPRPRATCRTRPISTGTPRPTRFSTITPMSGHQEICDREQAFFLKAINEDLDLSDWMDAAVNSPRIVLAAEQSINEKRVVELA